MFAKVLKLLVLCQASLAWGLDFSELAHDPQWLRLGHYENTWRGPRSPFRGTFFLHPEGYKNPELELKATVEAFLHPTAEQTARYKMSPRCYFGARYKFLKTRLALPDEVCHDREEWKKKLNATTVSLIFAAADMNNAPSTFGHTFIKLNNPANVNKPLLDYVISYAANGDPKEAIFYALKGLIGLYDGQFSMLPFHQKIRDYINMEGRDIWEYPLHLAPAEVDLLIDHLLELESGRAPYLFVSDNCSYQLLRAIEVARPDLAVSAHMPWFVIPLDVVKRLTRVPDFTALPIYHKSLKTDYMQSYSALDSRERDDLQETVKDLVVRDKDLPVAGQAAVLETAMKYYSLRAYQSQTDRDAEKYKLAVQRAKLGMVTRENETSPPPAPDKTHDSSALYAGGGDWPGRGHFASLKFRPAFHDLEQPDDGMLSFNRIEVLTAEIRQYFDQRKFAIDNFTVVDLLNSPPMNHLDRNISWRARVGIEEDYQPDFEGGLGASFDFTNWLRFMSFGTARYTGRYLGLGPNWILAARPFSRLGLSADAAYFWDIHDKRLWEFKLKADWELARNWDIQLEHFNLRETQARLVYNFLF